MATAKVEVTKVVVTPAQKPYYQAVGLTKKPIERAGKGRIRKFLLRHAQDQGIVIEMTVKDGDATTVETLNG